MIFWNLHNADQHDINLLYLTMTIINTMELAIIHCYIWYVIHSYRYMSVVNPL